MLTDDYVPSKWKLFLNYQNKYQSHSKKLINSWIFTFVEERDIDEVYEKL